MAEEQVKTAEVVATVADKAVKNPLYSKSNWLGILFVVAPFIPGANVLIAAHPELAGLVAGLFTVAARAVTKKPIDWSVLKT